MINRLFLIFPLVISLFHGMLSIAETRILSSDASDVALGRGLGGVNSSLIENSYRLLAPNLPCHRKVL